MPPPVLYLFLSHLLSSIGTFCSARMYLCARQVHRSARKIIDLAVHRCWIPPVPITSFTSRYRQMKASWLLRENAFFLVPWILGCAEYRSMRGFFDDGWSPIRASFIQFNKFTALHCGFQCIHSSWFLFIFSFCISVSIFRNCVHIVSSILSRSTNQPINFVKFPKKNISSFQTRWRPFILILGTFFGQHLPVQLLETLITLNYCPDDLK